MSNHSDDSNDSDSDSGSEEEEEEELPPVEADEDDEDDDEDDEIEEEDDEEIDDEEEEEEEVSNSAAISPTTTSTTSTTSTPPLPPSSPSPGPGPTTTTTAAVQQQKLSKSWSIQSIYGPIYTGGKVTHLTLDPNNNDQTTTILVAPVMGDVGFFHVPNHQRITSIHDYENNNRGMEIHHHGGGGGDDDDDRDYQNNKYDRNAITAYAIAPTTAIATKTTTKTTTKTDGQQYDYVMMTCTQNNTIRLYTIQITTANRRNDDNDDMDAVLETDDASLTSMPTTAADNHNHHHPIAIPTVQIQLVHTNAYTGHTLPVTDIQFHGVFVATASVDGTVRIWDARLPAQPYLTHVFSAPRPPDTKSNAIMSVTCVRWIPLLPLLPQQQLIIAIGRDDGSIVIHNLRDSVGGGEHADGGTAKSSHARPRRRARRDHPDPQEDNGTTASTMIVLRDHMSPVTCMEWDTERELFITGGRDAVIHVWKYQMTSTTTTATTHGPTKSSTAFSYTRVSTLPIYEQIEGMVVLVAQHHAESAPNTTTIATAGTKGQIRFWDICTVTVEKGPLHQIKYDIVPSTKVTTNNIGWFGDQRGGYTSLQSLFVSSAVTSTTTTTTTTTTTSNRRTPAQTKQVLLLTDAEHNITFYSLQQTSEADCTIERQQQQQPQQYALSIDRTVVGYNDEILDLKLIPQHDQNSSERMVVVTNSSQIRVYDTGTLACTTVYDEYHNAIILGIDVSPCGRFIATCSKDQTIRLWSTMPNITQCVAVGTGHTDAIGSVALSRKIPLYDITGKAAMNGAGAFCVSVSVDRTLKRWNLPGVTALAADNNTTGQRNNNKNVLSLLPFSSAHAHEKDINIVAIAPNDSIIATGSQDKTVKLFKSTNLSLLATLKGHRRGVWDVCFSPYDRIVATGSGDKSIKLWSLNDYSCVRTFQGHVASVLRVRFLSGGLQLVSSGADGLVKLWTVRTNETEATMDAHTDRVWALDLTKDGKRMISGGADSQIVVWMDTTKEADEAKLAVEEEAILVDQKLANHLRRKEYGDALKISLERDKPHHALKVLNSMIEIDLQKGNSGLVSIQSYLKGCNHEQILRILRYCREWNTRARNSHVALLTVKAIISTIPIHVLASISGVPEIVAGIIPYIERHYERLDRLHASSYLFDFALASMGVFDASNDNSIEEYKKWAADSKLVLRPKKVDGRVDIGGNVIVGASRNIAKSAIKYSDSDDEDNESNELVTIGESDDSEEE